MKRTCFVLLLGVGVVVGLMLTPKIYSQTSKTGQDAETYTVKPQDTLWGIAETFYGTGFDWPIIAKRNNIEDPPALAIGTVLVIPNLSAIKPEPQVSRKNQPTPTPSSAQVSKEAPQTSQIAVVPQGDVRELEKYLIVEAALLGVSDNISMYFKDLESRQEISTDPTRSWIPASTIKSFVALEAFRQKKLGLIDFSNPVSIKAENVVPTELETDEFPRLRQGITVTIKQLVEAMIIQSDNTAYNTILDILDRRNVNLTLRSIGITETVVGEKLNLDNDQLQKDLQVPGRQPNTTTVKDVATLFDLFYTRQVPDADEMLAVFKRQKINNMIPALLPTKTVVAHKTGDWSPIFHDGGVVYKPSAPFILVIFTNSNDPNVLAQLARVAYFQDARVVGKGPTAYEIKTPRNQYHANIFLVATPREIKILGEKTEGSLNEKFPKITAADLGIKFSDLAPSKRAARKVNAAVITPRSALYGVKRFYERLELILALGLSGKIAAHLDVAMNRLSEAKTLLGERDFKLAENTLAESEVALRQAAFLANRTDKTRNINLSLLKQVNDLHFATLAERAEHVNDDKKKQFIDLVYRFYQKNRQEVVPVLRKSLVTNPFEQQPIIGTVKEVKGNVARLEFADGTTKEMLLPTTVRVRDFHKENIDISNNLIKGSKIAVIGQGVHDGKIIPTFILKNIPKELPDKHEGTVIEISPSEKTLKIQENSGQEEQVKIDEKTILKSRDTGVSLEGIKAGSRVTIFGEPQQTTSATSQTGSQQTGGLPSSAELKATSVTVTSNSSGAQEKVSSPTSPTSSSSGSSKKEEQKKKESKKKEEQKK